MLATETFMMNSFSGQTAMPRGRAVGSKRKQQGAVLIIGLILLMVITLLALAGIQGVSLQERMSGNAYDRNIAFNEAEVGLRYVEHQLLARNDSGLGSFQSADKTEYTQNGKTDVSITTGYAGLSNTTQQIAVVDLGDDCFMVNSQGLGRSSNTQVVLQSVVCRD